MEYTPVNEETQTIGNYLPQVVEQIEVKKSKSSFIEANTVECSLHEVNNTHIIPVYTRENTPLISQGDFLEAAMVASSRVYANERILKPDIRVSHPIKGRIPEARNKPANQLEEWEKTLYYDRLAFIIEVPSIFTDVDGNKLTLTIAGVKCYSQENLLSKSFEQSFKIAVGFTCKVCTNLCINSDGFVKELKVKNVDALYNGIHYLLSEFNAVQFAEQLKTLPNFELSESQFAHLVGRCRLFRHMPEGLKQQIPDLMFGDSQINSVCRDYYSDLSFCRNDNGNISLWKLYNLFTGANKSSYIDSYLERATNAFQLTQHIQTALDNRSTSWFLN